MAPKYARVKALTKEVFARKAAGETNQQIADSYGLELEQIKNLVRRENRRARLVAAGYVIQPKGRCKKSKETEQERLNNELIKLRMQVEVLRNFLSEAGRR